jgi:hypothetical protein
MHARDICVYTSTNTSYIRIYIWIEVDGYHAYAIDQLVCMTKYVANRDLARTGDMKR